MPMPERCSRFAEYRDIVLELFASKGFGQVGMRELATCLGLSPGSLYHHYPSKQHLLLDLIEEFYEELLSTLGRIDQKGSAKRDKLPNLIRAHLNLHREMPWHFRLAERDSGCLNAEQQARVRQLREQYERTLLKMLGAPSRLGEQGLIAAGHAIANLLNSAPGWLAHHPLEEAQRDELLESLVIGAVERLLRPSPATRAAA
ncbi:MAG: TetR/AcrR family transcriptional regulator [Pseudomonas mandelii]|jgi:AcrR family transcriptional regulator|uniref:TetR/AcrR family transcriptional regulator n=2 Tax=Pseudomonas fluorescens group TaxID=136843 RepID=A0AB36CTR6_9PSED|nr:MULTISPECIES: TetR/AcrR family transcriptional regulator [Pseudomonas]MBA4363578.1 TetR/AcrR family transcriptional regulator [Pseudomonas sp.]MDO8709844.1 TetR/AcrR family transcriptional regulator [Pseudomonas sp.]MSU92754.1 TetR/AcrR family transcriptional regulator [Pseudomonas mandelii]NMZ79292.1 TetR/AcrR family transcriptional regulator [Pseudomonas mandelii]OOL38390.1 TetR family transcriptional regulator [Pseudomonas sp. FSL W5-0299]